MVDLARRVLVIVAAAEQVPGVRQVPERREAGVDEKEEAAAE